MSKTNGFVIFVAGAAFGFFTARLLLRSKYEQIAQDEIDSVKETLHREIKNADARAKARFAKEKPDVVSKEYSSILKKEGYHEYSRSRRDTAKMPKPDISDVPFVISPDQFGETYNETISLTYYADGVLTDGDDRKVEDAEETVGPDALDSFGQYEEDSVYVRDDKIGVDYEILLDLRNYSDVEKTKPRQIGE